MTIPILPESSWRITVATMDKTIAHISEKPKFAPASVQTVTVPGPINAAAISGPGPRFLKNEWSGKAFFFAKIEIWVEFLYFLFLRMVFLNPQSSPFYDLVEKNFESAGRFDSFLPLFFTPAISTGTTTCEQMLPTSLRQ